MNHIFQTSVLIMECVELNWLCKHIKKIRSSQPAILVLNWVQQQSFPVHIINVKSFEISNELCHSLPGLQIYPDFAQSSESESLTGRSERISSKVNFQCYKRCKYFIRPHKLWGKCLLLQLCHTSLVFFTSL